MVISQFYMSRRAKQLEPKELLAVLASCIVDGKVESEVPLAEIRVPQIVRDSLYDLNEIWRSLGQIENTQKSLESPWNLSTSWIGPIWDWMGGDSVATISGNYGVYEGNLIRSVLKLQNMLDEWRSMAAFCEHTDMMDKFRDAHTLLIREAVIQDSLYLHM
jgi:superfamily II RNA helicase